MHFHSARVLPIQSESSSTPLQYSSTHKSQRFATQEKQGTIIQSIVDSIPTVTPYQQKQYARIIEHLKADDSANLQMIMVGTRSGFENATSDQRNLFPGPETPESLHQITGAMCLQYPVSRGSVHIKTNNVNDHPTVDPGYLSHPADVGVLAAGITMLGHTEKSAHLADKIAARVKPLPEIDICDQGNAEKWVRDWVISEYHVCGSVAMGDALDTRLRVKGANNLRVIDASVFPNNVSGNIVSSVYMVAERGADIIKEDLGRLGSKL
jgi:choline dehydrogenase-like flavoprotein